MIEVPIVEQPQRLVLDHNNPLTKLQRGVKSALMALPGEFDFEHTVSGVAATDLFSLNTFMGAGIELEVVRTLNKLRTIWDPDSEWSTYSFERSSQAFPDVKLVDGSADGEKSVALGIELKGWWMLSKEGVPSLRYEVSPTACADHDLVCVVPWYLSSAVSGEPQVVEPWIESARYAAEWRDHWWTVIRRSKGDPTLNYPEDAEPYPTKADHVSVHPAEDGGGNFGRLPRCKPLMDDFITKTMRTPILGISTEAWVEFLKLHKDGEASNQAVLDSLRRKLGKKESNVAPDIADEILYHLEQLRGLMSP